MSPALAVRLRLETPSLGIANYPLRAPPVSKNDGLRAIPTTTTIITFARTHSAGLYELNPRKYDNFAVKSQHTPARRSNLSDTTVATPALRI